MEISEGVIRLVLLLDLHNSSDGTQLHQIIVNYVQRMTDLLTREPSDAELQATTVLLNHH